MEQQSELNFPISCIMMSIQKVVCVKFYYHYFCNSKELFTDATMLSRAFLYLETYYCLHFQVDQALHHVARGIETWIYGWNPKALTTNS